MSFGIQIKDQAGKVVYDTSSITWNLVLSVMLPAGQGGTVNVPSLIGKQSAVQCAFTSLPSPRTGARAPVVSVDSVSGNVTVTQVGDLSALILVFMR